MAVKIITDNCSDLPQDLIKALDIEMVHMLVRFGVKEFLPETLDLDEFYGLMKTSPELPTTSQPTIEELKEAFERNLADGSEVICILLSSGITGTVQSAEMIRDEVEGKERLFIIDSKKASTGEGLMVVEAARMAKAGASAEKILERLEEMQRRVRCVFTIDTLEYLVKGGRISKTKGLISEVLDIKPILHFDQEGFIVPYDKTRGRKAALRKIIKIIEDEAVDIKSQTVGVSHTVCPEDAENIRDIMLNRFQAKEVIMGKIGPVIGSHVGPGTLAVFFES